jgi:hypothetical protein
MKWDSHADVSENADYFSDKLEVYYCWYCI